jgi:hypothetical protein
VPAQAALALVVLAAAAIAAPPAAAAGDGTRSAPATPFTSTRPGEVVVPVAIGDRGPFRFLLDTGSTHSAISERLAAELDAEPVARTVMRAAGGPVACLVVALPAVTVGVATAAGITATVLPPPAGSIIRVDLDGVLGQDFLSRVDFTIDYRRSRIDWHAAGYDAPGIRLALTPAQDRWLVELPQPSSSGTAATVRRFVPDSGADTLVLFGEARARCLIAEWRAGAAALGSLTGARIVRTATVDGLHVGSARLDRQVAAIVPASADDPDGLLPLHLFARVFFSARSRALVIQPR